MSNVISSFSITFISGCKFLLEIQILIIFISSLGYRLRFVSSQNRKSNFRLRPIDMCTCSLCPNNFLLIQFDFCQVASFLAVPEIKSFNVTKKKNPFHIQTRLNIRRESYVSRLGDYVTDIPLITCLLHFLRILEVINNYYHYFLA